MKQTHNLTIPLPPQGKGRGRAVRAGAGVRVITPAKTRNFEAVVADLAAEQIEGGIIEGPVAVRIVAVFARPKRLAMVYKKTGRPKHPIGWLHCPQTPDADNIAKAVIDGLRAVWRDDRQVVSLEILKVYGVMVRRGESWAVEPPRVDVEIEELGDAPTVRDRRLSAIARGA